MTKENPFSPFSRSLYTVSFIVIIALLSGCNMPGGSVIPSISSPTPTLTMIQNSPTEATPTLSLTPTVTMTTTPPGSSIVFTQGTTASVRQGSLTPGQTKSYTLAAEKNQAMVLILDSLYHDIHFAVSKPDGSLLVDPSWGWINFQWILPATGTYTIQVIGGTITENYTLTVKVAAPISVPAGGGPKIFSGTTFLGYVFSYGVNGQSGKTMHLSLNVPASSAYLDVFGIADDHPLLDESLHLTNWSGVLPSTQIYIVEIIPASGQEVNFSLTITVD
jgi:hypothetical protein